ncbi:MAG: hypothetical protein U9Q30_09075 [Campylobacterota bacterium]|nr:hypothetical protein [Campylobacterota bacterium]
MNLNIEDIFNDKKNTFTINKVLCIVEGKDELTMLKTIYETWNDTNIDCSKFCNDIIELSYGKSNIRWINESKCNFQGGDIDGCKVPNTILEALYKEDLDLYYAIIVMFDSDCDVGDIVKNNSTKILSKYNSKIIISNPCFEKHLISIIKKPIDTDEYINSNYEIINDSKCKWFKSNFSKVPRLNKFKKVLTTEKLFTKINKDDLTNTNIDEELKELIDFAKSSLGKS